MTKRGLDWYKRDPIAFLDAVQGMGPDVIGAYAVILDLIYARAGETRRDDRHLAGIMGCSVRKAAALTDALIAAGKLHCDGGVLTNSRAANQASERANLSAVRSEAGRSGGIASGAVRREKSRENVVRRSRDEDESDVRRSRDEVEKDTSCSNNRELHEASASSKHEAEKRREDKPPISPKGEEPDRFEEFWSFCPKKAGKGTAKRSWSSAIKRAPPEVIIDGMRRYAGQREGEDPRYTAHPSTWLNGERWADEAGGNAQPSRKKWAAL